MAETVNISAMAEKVSAEIFSLFGWGVSGSTNENFPCEKLEEHQKKSSPTHPTDVVFEYNDPYEGERIYFLTDLKSYAKGSLTASNLRVALRDLAKSVDCANVSNKWKDSYANSAVNYQICGLLFIYNHDGEYDKDFTKLLRDSLGSSLPIPRNRRIFVIGPARIVYLLNILTDIEREQGKQRLPHFSGKIPFLYPDRVRKLTAKRELDVARIELLLGPWQMIPYSINGNDGLYFYYDGTGERWEEFTFIFDFCFKTQLVSDARAISVRLPNAHPSAAKHFEVAKENYLSSFYHGFPKSRMDQFSFVAITRHVEKFSSEQLGMERRAK